MKYLLTLALLIGVKSALACSCAQWGAARDILTVSDGAFLGVPAESSKKTNERDEWGELLLKTKFSVVKNFKGHNQKRTEIFHAEGTGGNCGIGFIQDDQLWLVFTFKSEGKHYSNSCLLSGLDTPEERAFLRELSSL